MDLTRFRRLAREVDDQQRAAQRAIEETLPGGEQASGLADGRRAFLRGLGLGGTALTVGGLVLARTADAGAQTTTTTDEGATTSAAGTTSTTAPPQQPTEADVAILVFAQTFELGLAELYELAIERGVLSEEVASIVAAFGDHHLQHAQAYAGLAGKAAINRPNEAFVREHRPAIEAASDESALLEVLFELENTAASSYVAALERVRGLNASTVMANVLPIESRHAAVLGEALGLRLPQYAPVFQEPDDGVGPDEFPVAQR